MRDIYSIGSNIPLGITQKIEQIVQLQNRIAQLEAELAAAKLSRLDKENLEIGRQLQRAANDLPDLFNIEIDVENGCAGVTLINEDGNRRSFILDEHLSDTISEAIDAAIKEQGFKAASALEDF